MNVFFNTKFENIINYEIGQTYKLNKYKLGLFKGVESSGFNYDSFNSRTTSFESSYRGFESLWYKEGYTLSMTISPDAIISESGSSTILAVYYSNYNDDTIDIAFILTPDIVYSNSYYQMASSGLNICINRPN